MGQRSDVFGFPLFTFNTYIYMRQRHDTHRPPVCDKRQHDPVAQRVNEVTGFRQNANEQSLKLDS